METPDREKFITGEQVRVMNSCYARGRDVEPYEASFVRHVGED